jgi:hypothetical protein
MRSKAPHYYANAMFPYDSAFSASLALHFRCLSAGGSCNQLQFYKKCCKLFYKILERFLMSKLFSSILFSFFLLLHTTAIAEEETIPEETNIEVQEVQEGETSEETESTEVTDEQESQAEVTEEAQEEVEPEEVLSEAEKEALAAEAAELREAGMGEEPVAE